MVLSSLVELGMLIIARASTVEAVETNIETSRFILEVVINIKAMRFVGIALLEQDAAHYRIEALCAVLSVYCIVRSGRSQRYSLRQHVRILVVQQSQNGISLRG